ncbi:MAG: type transporter [Fibrobacteres bacterium]|nr:type transporter [Fibrobacterota bacterium]
MKRLAASVGRDLLIQAKRGYPFLAALAAFLTVLAFAHIPQGNSDTLAPFASLAFSFSTTVPFLVLQALGEKREGSLDLLDHTPLRPHEYLASKAISLAIPSIACNTAMVLVSRGPYFNPFPFWIGLAAAGTLFACFGFQIAALGGSVPKALGSCLVAALPLLLPFFPMAGPGPAGLYLLHPLAGASLLIRRSYQGDTWTALILGAGMSIVWIGAALVLCRKAFARFRRQPDR